MTASNTASLQQDTGSAELDKKLLCKMPCAFHSVMHMSNGQQDILLLYKTELYYLESND